MKRPGFLAEVLDFLMPRACCICGGRLSTSENAICGPCNFHLPRTHYEQSAADNSMVRQFWGVVPVENSVAWFYFEPHSQAARMIYRLKYGNNPELGELLGHMYADEIKNSGFFEDIDLILPVPLARKRERMRGYNQSLMIARGISEVTGIAVSEHCLKRKAFEVSQTRKNWWERRDNVAGVFGLCAPDKVSGRHILIVDDVMTTGATVSECVRELQKAGDVRISILTLGMTKS